MPGAPLHIREMSANYFVRCADFERYGIVLCICCIWRTGATIIAHPQYARVSQYSVTQAYSSMTTHGHRMNFQLPTPNELRVIKYLAIHLAQDNSDTH